MNRVPAMLAVMLLGIIAISGWSPSLVQAQGRLIGEAPISSRDSLRLEIEQYSQAISGLRDSLNLDDFDIQFSDEQRLRLEDTIEDFTQIIEQIGGELGEMELEIVNNRISLLDDDGEGIVIDIPENLDEQLSQGFEILQQIILNDMPEEQSEKIQQSWSWGLGKPAAEPERVILKGNIVKVWDNLQIAEDEDVRGNVVVIFGDGEISGRVDGNVVAVFGNLRLDETAEITGQVVAVGGHLDQDRLAEVGDVVVVDPFPGWGDSDFTIGAGNGILSLVVGIGEFLLIALLTLLVMAITPRIKMDRVIRVLEERALPSIVTGVMGSLGISLLGLVLIGVLVLTVIGIPVALLVLVAMLLFSVLSVGVVALALGRRVCTLLSGRCGSDWMVLFLGLILLDAISLVGQLAGLLPPLGGVSHVLVVVGSAIKMVAYLFGAGALLLSGFGRK